MNINEFENVKFDAAAFIAANPLWNSDASEVGCEVSIHFEAKAARKKRHFASDVIEAPFAGFGLVSVENLEGMTDESTGIFSKCELLERVQLPNTLTMVPARAFFGCPSLDELTLPKGITRISTLAFYGTHSLNKLTIRGKLTTIEDGAFAGSGITHIHLPDTVTSLGSNCFMGSALETFTVPKGVTEIPMNCFRNCANLKKVVLHKEVTVIHSGAFANCPDIKIVGASRDSQFFDNAYSVAPELMYA